MERRNHERIFLPLPIEAELYLFSVDGIEKSQKQQIPVTIEDFSILGMGLMGKLPITPEQDKQNFYRLTFKYNKNLYEVFGEIPWVDDKRKTPQHQPKFLYGFELTFLNQAQFTHYYGFYNQYCIQKRIRLLNTKIPNWNEYDSNRKYKALSNPLMKDDL